MKRSNTPSRPTSPRSDRRRTLAFTIVGSLAIAATTACVSSGKHGEVVAERDQLDQQRMALEQQLENARISNESLAQELETLLEDFEDERISRQDLESRVASLSETERELSVQLATTSTELEKSQAELAKTSAEVEKLNSTYTNLVSDLEAELAAGQIQIEQLKEGLRVNVADDVLFAPGSAQLDGIGRDVLGKVAAQLAELDHHVEVQGHTDNVPIRGTLSKRFPTNWELGAARAARVARLLQEEGVSGDRLIVASFAEYRPLAANDSAEGRAMNRRIEIRLLPLDEPALEDVAATDAASSSNATP